MFYICIFIFIGVNVAAKVLKQNNYSKELINAEMHRVNIAHKNIVQILGYHQGPALSIIMLELCGPSLENLIEERPLSKKERISFLKDITQALTHCHNANVIHADIKPKNIFISDQNKAKLGDFGSSVIYNKSSETNVSIKVQFILSFLLGKKTDLKICNQDTESVKMMYYKSLRDRLLAVCTATLKKNHTK